MDTMFSLNLCLVLMCESIPVTSISPGANPWAYPRHLKKLFKCLALPAIFVGKCPTPIPNMVVKCSDPQSIQSIYKKYYWQGFSECFEVDGYQKEVGVCFLFFFYLFFLLTEQLQYFWINSNMKKKKCSDEEAQEKPQGLCELSFLKI